MPPGMRVPHGMMPVGSSCEKVEPAGRGRRVATARGGRGMARAAGRYCTPPGRRSALGAYLCGLGCLLSQMPGAGPRRQHATIDREWTDMMLSDETRRPNGKESVMTDVISEAEAESIRAAFAEGKQV